MEYPEIDQNKTETATTPGLELLDHGRDESAGAILGVGGESFSPCAMKNGCWCFIQHRESWKLELKYNKTKTTRRFIEKQEPPKQLPPKWAEIWGGQDPIGHHPGRVSPTNSAESQLEVWPKRFVQEDPTPVRQNTCFSQLIRTKDYRTARNQSYEDATP